MIANLEFTYIKCYTLDGGVRMKAFVIFVFFAVISVCYYHPCVFADVAEADGSASAEERDNPPTAKPPTPPPVIVPKKGEVEEKAKIKADNKNETAPFVLTGPAVVLDEKP